MVERHWARGILQCRAQLELRVIGDERAGEHRRSFGALAFDHHARGRAHEIRRRFAARAQSRLGDFRDVGARVHFRKKHQRVGIAGLDRDGVRGKQPGVAVALGGLVLAPHGAAGDRDVEVLAREPDEAFEGRREGAGAALVRVALRREVIERDADLQALAMALTGMVRDGEVSRARAVELARMVLRENARQLYGL